MGAARIGREPSLSSTGTLLPQHCPFLVHRPPPEKAGPSRVPRLPMSPFGQLHDKELVGNLQFTFSLYSVHPVHEQNLLLLFFSDIWPLPLISLCAVAA